jgi:hypothetical protein
MRGRERADLRHTRNKPPNTAWHALRNRSLSGSILNISRLSYSERTMPTYHVLYVDRVYTKGYLTGAAMTSRIVD